MIKRKKVSDEERRKKILERLEEVERKTHEAHVREDAHFGIVADILKRMEPLPVREIMLLIPEHYNYFHYRMRDVRLSAEDLTENGKMYIQRERLKLATFTHGGLHRENERPVYYYWNPRSELLVCKIFTADTKAQRVGPLRLPKKAK